MCEKTEYIFCLSGEKCPLCLDYMPPLWEHVLNEDWSERLMPPAVENSSKVNAWIENLRFWTKIQNRYMEKPPQSESKSGSFFIIAHYAKQK